MSKPRRRHTAEQKAELLRQHVAEKKPVSECMQRGRNPAEPVLQVAKGAIGWRRIRCFRPVARASFARMSWRRRSSRLEARVARKDQIIAEVTEEYVTLKKKLGEA